MGLGNEGEMTVRGLAIKNGSRGSRFCRCDVSAYSTIITLQVLVLPTVSILSP